MITGLRSRSPCGRSIRHALFLLILAWAGCRGHVHAHRMLGVTNWFDPSIGRGRVHVVRPEGAWDLCFSCKTGGKGLFLAKKGGSAVVFGGNPRSRALPMLKTVHVTTGRFKRAAILTYKRDHLVLYSENTFGCLDVERLVEIRDKGPLAVVSTRVHNLCNKGRVFHDIVPKPLQGHDIRVVTAHHGQVLALGPNATKTTSYALLPRRTSSRTIPDLFARYAKDIPRDHRPLSGVLFEQEEVHMDISRGKVTITGRYLFHNPGPRDTMAGIFFPFPLDKGILYPDRIDVSGIPFSRTARGIRFDLHVKGNEKRWVTIRYTQRLKDSRAVYIVRSALAWHRPILRARFRIRYPSCFTNVHQPYRPASTGKGVIRLDIKDFVPVRDIVVTWKDHCNDKSGMRIVDHDRGGSHEDPNWVREEK